MKIKNILIFFITKNRDNNYKEFNSKAPKTKYGTPAGIPYFILSSLSSPSTLPT